MPSSLRSIRHKRLQALLVDARKAARLTQTEVARRLGKPQSFVAKYEGGERRLDVIEFLDVAVALDTRPGKLLTLLLQSMTKAKLDR